MLPETNSCLICYCEINGININEEYLRFPDDIFLITSSLGEDNEGSTACNI